MNAGVVHAFTEVPRYTSFADPAPAQGEAMVKVMAAGLHPIVRALANGTHYGSAGVLPFIPGVDGVGRLEDGSEVYFGASRPPFGTFSEFTVTTRGMYIPIKAGLDPVTIAGIANPGMSSWVALTRRARFVAGERVLILGATGIAGQLAVQIAKHLGAGRVLAAGRNRAALERARELGADATIPLDQERDSLISSIRREAEETGIDIVLDYVWGVPAEAALEAMSQKRMRHAVTRIRFVQIGNSAGATITLAAATLRSTAIELLGSGFGSASLDEIFRALAEFFELAARATLKIDLKAVPLREVESVWNAPERDVRLVFVP
jgi:NADPH:quinone reductase-like Zn-dependent oxidoreductase